MDAILKLNEEGERSFQEFLPEVSEKNTKSEIVKAYQTLAKKYEDRVKEGKIKAVKKIADNEVIQRTEAYTVSVLAMHTEEMKNKVVEVFNTFSQQLVTEAKKLEEINQAISMQRERLQSFYDIEVAVIGLEDIIKVQEEKKEAFEAENHKMCIVRQQEEEEYRYQMARERKREALVREEEEEILRKRKEELVQQETEIKELRKKVEIFPNELLQATTEAAQETEEWVRKEMRIQAEIVAKETAGERKVMETRIAFFEEVIKRQNEEVSSSKKEVDQAVRQVQSIAEKAIEGSAGKQTLKAVSDIIVQQARGSKLEE